MRLSCLVCWPAFLLGYCAVGLTAEIGALAPFEAPQIVLTRQAGVYLRQEATVRLAQGANRLSFDFARWDIDPATLDLRLLQPRGTVQLAEQQLPAEQAGRVVWVLMAEQAGECRLRLTCGLKGLEAGTLYTLMLSPGDRQLSLEAQVTLKNGSKLPLPEATVSLPSGQRLTAHLALGEAVQQRLFRFEGVPYEARYLYDNSRFQDSVRALLRVRREGTTEFDKMALPAGRVKVFAPAGGGLTTFVGENDLPYRPPGEKVDLDLGVVPEISVLRTRVRGDQVNVRTDVYKKLALFDLEEELEFEIENHRPGPVVLLIQEHVAGDWQMVKHSHPFEKLDAGTIEFTLKLDPDQKTKMNYVVRRLNVEP